MSLPDHQELGREDSRQVRVRLMAVEEEVVEADVEWDGEEVEEVEEEVLEVDQGAEEERLGVVVVVVVVAEDLTALQEEEEERVEVMVAESDLEHRP